MQISIRRTPHFIPKTAESERDIDMPQSAMAILREYSKVSTSEFVLPGGMSNIAGRSKHYRAASIWQAHAKWLGEKGVTARAKIHSLRKESGSLIADVLGIEAARMHLAVAIFGSRHSTTSAKSVASKSHSILALSPNTGEMLSGKY